MYSLISILILIVCVLLVLIVLVQNSKGGGLASNFANTGQVMGVRKTSDFLEKSTWTLAICLVVFCVMAVAFIPRASNTPQGSRIMEQVQRTSAGSLPTELPALPQSSEEQADETTPATPEATPAPAE